MLQRQDKLPQHHYSPRLQNHHLMKKSYESDRLSKDKKAMDEMKQVSDEEFAKGLRTPWKWKIRKAIWDYMEENDIVGFQTL